MKKSLILIFCLFCLFSFFKNQYYQINCENISGSEPINGKIYKEVTIIIDKDALIPKTYYWNSKDFSGTLYYKTSYPSHHDSNQIYVIYSGYVYSKFN